MLCILCVLCVLDRWVRGQRSDVHVSVRCVRERKMRRVLWLTALSLLWCVGPWGSFFNRDLHFLLILFGLCGGQFACLCVSVCAVRVFVHFVFYF